MARQIMIWHYKVEMARGEEISEFQDRVNRELYRLGDKVEKVYTIGVGHDMVVTAVLMQNDLLVKDASEEDQCR